jgi:putative transposase
MPPFEKHHKRVKHFDDPGHAHELTFSCYHGLPLLASEHACALLAREIDRAVARHRFCVVGFVFMPEHIHLIVHPQDSACRVSSLLWAVKRPHSFRVKQDMAARGDPWIERLTVRERPGTLSFRFWQEGPGHDRNLIRPEVVRAAVEYAHANPVRRGLCAAPSEWKWSSWHYYCGEGPPDPDLPTVHGFPA